MKKNIFVLGSLSLGFFLLAAVGYSKFYNRKIIISSNVSVSSLKSIEDKDTLGIQKTASVVAENIKISSPSADKISPTNMVEVKPAGFCLNVPVIFYHHIEPIGQAKTEGHVQLTVDAAIFDGQMKYLIDHGYRTISAEELVNAIYSHKSLGKAVVVTIDDGYSDAYNYAFTIAKKYGVILNLMIPTGLLNNPGYMSWENLKEMVNSGLATAYDHSWSHYSMPKGDETKIQMEVMTAKNQLEQNLGKTVKIFTYPYGSSDQKTVNILQKNGFIAAFSTIPSFYQCESYIFNLRRNRIGNASLSSYGL